jgi:hypothetical protein
VDAQKQISHGASDDLPFAIQQNCLIAPGSHGLIKSGKIRPIAGEL